MVRPHTLPSSTLRNRNRITNKTRLKVHLGNLDADPIITDEEEEKNRLLQRVAGVDQEDANEHHLQQVLSEAAARHQVNTRARGSGKSNEKAAFIPTPDSTGVVDNYDKLYPPRRWRDPVSYVQSSQTVEESCHGALAHGCTYFMDERDKDWLDKNNEEARGEGTSTQAAVSPSGTRTSARSSKAKGKEPEAAMPVEISDDHFELVMGLFELITHEETEFLHHSIRDGMQFPEFSAYQDIFANPLLPSHFAMFAVPNGVPPPADLLNMARTVYPHWKDRRVERNGMRIIPQLNGDEADTLNESYVCFRRREVKAARKTRGSQPNSSERLMALQRQLYEPFEIAKRLFRREVYKRESTHHALNIWQRRVAIVDLRRRNAALGDKADEELLVDKEIMVKKSDLRRQMSSKLDLGVAPVVPQIRTDPIIRPSERCAILNTRIEGSLQKRKEMDHQWEDVVDNSYIAPLVPFQSRLFRYIPPAASTSTSSTSNPTSDDDSPWVPPPTPRQPRPIRLRRGRGGRMHIDRREVSFPSRRPRPQLAKDAMDVDEDPEAERRVLERWRFDEDDTPAVGPGGPEEQDRVLVEDYSHKYVQLLADIDPHILTDNSLVKFRADGSKEGFIPYRLGNTAVAPLRRDPPRTASTGPMISLQGQQAQAAVSQSGMPPGTPISMQQQIKMSSVAERPMRISSNGGMRTPVSGGIQANGMQATSPPPSASPTHQSSPSFNGTNAGSRAAINMPHLDSLKIESNLPIQANGIVPSQPQQSSPQAAEGLVNGSYITRPKSQDASHAVLNPYQLNGYQANGHTINHTTVSSLQQIQQMQNLKQLLAAQQQNQEMQTMHTNGIRGVNVPGSYMFNGMKIPAVRQQPQWPTSGMSGYEGINVNGSPHTVGQVTPVRTPSGNGRTMMSPSMQQSPSPIPHTPIPHSQSPRLPPTPMMAPTQPIAQNGY